MQCSCKAQNGVQAFDGAPTNISLEGNVMQKTTYTYFCDVCGHEIGEQVPLESINLSLAVGNYAKVVKHWGHLCDECYDGIFDLAKAILEHYPVRDTRGSKE